MKKSLFVFALLTAFIVTSLFAYVGKTCDVYYGSDGSNDQIYKNVLIVDYKNGDYGGIEDYYFVTFMYKGEKKTIYDNKKNGFFYSILNCK